MTGFLSFLLESLFPGICLVCGAGLAGPERSFTVPHGWPPETADFLCRDFSFPLFRGVAVPARILCSQCWLSLEPARHAVFISITEGRVNHDPPREEASTFGQVAGGTVEAVHLVSPFVTNDTLLEIIRFLKFSGGQTAIPPLSWWMALSISRHLEGRFLDPSPGPVVVPVPLHPTRERRRGYNQAGLLAGGVAARLGFDFGAAVLERIRKTRRQAKLDSAGRAENVHGAFRVVKTEMIESRDVILVDDLVTTGHTARACIAALKEGFASSTTVLTAGRTRGLKFF
ncbi:MAG: ComF family protein [Candidatus Krumholzibacteria bacterium]|nr:ComF family protein [Candidatus Krumholzibacteria bacterium]